MGAPAPPGWRKKFSGVIYRNTCKCTPRTRSAPPARARVIFRTVFAGRVRFGGIFRRSLRATTKKRSSTFLARKSAPPIQNPGYAYAHVYTHFTIGETPGYAPVGARLSNLHVPCQVSANVDRCTIATHESLSDCVR